MAVRALTNDELKIITDNGDNAFLTKHPKRDRLLFFMGIKTGMKNETMLKITIGDLYRGVNVVDHLVMVNSHSPSKSIRYKLDEDLRCLIDDWVSEMRDKITITKETPLFCNMVTGDLSAITGQQFNNIVKQICSDNLHTDESYKFSSMILRKTFERLSKIEEAKKIVSQENIDINKEKEEVMELEKLTEKPSVIVELGNKTFDFTASNTITGLSSIKASDEEKLKVLEVMMELVSDDGISLRPEVLVLFTKLVRAVHKDQPHIRMMTSIHMRDSGVTETQLSKGLSKGINEAEMIF